MRERMGLFSQALQSWVAFRVLGLISLIKHSWISTLKWRRASIYLAKINSEITRAKTNSTMCCSQPFTNLWFGNEECIQMRPQWSWFKGCVGYNISRLNGLGILSAPHLQFDHIADIQINKLVFLSSKRLSAPLHNLSRATIAQYFHDFLKLFVSFLI